MKKTLLTLSFFAIVGLFNANATEVTTVSNTTTEYVVNDANIDALFATSTDVSVEMVSSINLNAVENTATNQMFVKNGGSKSAIVAILLDWLVGGLGVHRIYLGTATMTWVGYILTCGGGCGIVPTIDFWVMVFNFNNIDKFVDNSKFFMW